MNINITIGTPSYVIVPIIHHSVNILPDVINYHPEINSVFGQDISPGNSKIVTISNNGIEISNGNFTFNPLIDRQLPYSRYPDRIIFED